MTKSEYMKKLSYSLRRLPKEDFNQAIDYFEEYFAEAGEENEQQAIEDLGSPEECGKRIDYESGGKEYGAAAENGKTQF
mgnify:CR=1 FL=1